MNNVKIFTDGACSGNPGPGGWGAIIRWNGVEKELFGGEDDTTNNRMEMLAVIESLRMLKRECAVMVYTDSKYVLQGATEWLEGWKRTDWKKGKLKNIDLWKALDAELARHSVNWEWVKGHAGHPENERADVLAFTESQRRKEALRA